MARFGRVLTAMVSPFDERGELDLDAAVSLARWLVDQGNEGLVVTGTTGESPTLSHEEDERLWRAVVQAVSVPVIAGAGNNDTASSIERAKAAESAGAAGILAVTPYYNRPSQAGLEAHFGAIAGATTLPVMLYDIPFRTGRKLESATIVRLADEHSNIVALKDAAGNVPATATLMTELPAGFELYSGEDVLNLPLMSIGAVGLVSVAAHWAAPEMVAMWDAWERGDTAEALRLDRALRPSYAFESSDAAPNPVPSKAMMRVLGHAVGEPRLPVGPTPPGLEDEARRVLAELRGSAPA
ncbi:MAG: 4-hydroxy-tetrahydrodipicolinate synthase [Actinomycetota bacterium]